MTTIETVDPLDARFAAMRTLVQSIRDGGFPEPWLIQHTDGSATAYCRPVGDDDGPAFSLYAEGEFRAQFSRDGVIWSCWGGASAREAFDGCKASRAAPKAVTL